MTQRTIAFLFLLFAWSPTESMAQVLEIESCYSGSLGSAGIGICRPGIRARSTSGWSLCTGEILPSVEIVDNMIDEDCNGIVSTSVTVTYDPRSDFAPTRPTVRPITDDSVVYDPRTDLRIRPETGVYNFNQIAWLITLGTFLFGVALTALRERTLVWGWTRQWEIYEKMSRETAADPFLTRRRYQEIEDLENKLKISDVVFDENERLDQYPLWLRSISYVLGPALITVLMAIVTILPGLAIWGVIHFMGAAQVGCGWVFHGLLVASCALVVAFHVDHCFVQHRQVIHYIDALRALEEKWRLLDAGVFPQEDPSGVHATLGAARDD